MNLRKKNIFDFSTLTSNNLRTGCDAKKINNSFESPNVVTSNLKDKGVVLLWGDTYISPKKYTFYGKKGVSPHDDATPPFFLQINLPLS